MKYVIEVEKKSRKACSFAFLIIIDVPCLPTTKLIELAITLWIQLFYSELFLGQRCPKCGSLIMSP
jgi:hypothetical protein